MDIPEDVGRLLDSERVKRAVASIQVARTEIVNARDALGGLPSNRDVVDLLDRNRLRDDPRDTLRSIRDSLDMLAERLTKLAERCP